MSSGQWTAWAYGASASKRQTSRHAPEAPDWLSTMESSASSFRCEARGYFELHTRHHTAGDSYLGRPNTVRHNRILGVPGAKVRSSSPGKADRRLTPAP